MREHHNLRLALAAMAASGMDVRIADVGEPVLVIGGSLDGPGPFKMKEEDRQAARDRSTDILATMTKPQASTRASINRNTGNPHGNAREIARRLRREQRAKGGAA